jgi:hypothetical protein
MTLLLEEFDNAGSLVLTYNLSLFYPSFTCPKTCFFLFCWHQILDSNYAYLVWLFAYTLARFVYFYYWIFYQFIFDLLQFIPEIGMFFDRLQYDSLHSCSWKDFLYDVGEIQLVLTVNLFGYCNTVHYNCHCRPLEIVGIHTFANFHCSFAGY